MCNVESHELERQLQLESGETPNHRGGRPSEDANLLNVVEKYIGGKNLWGQKSLGGGNCWGGKSLGEKSWEPFAHDFKVGHLVDVVKNFAKGKLLRDSKKPWWGNHELNHEFIPFAHDFSVGHLVDIVVIDLLILCTWIFNICSKSFGFVLCNVMELWVYKCVT